MNAATFICPLLSLLYVDKQGKKNISMSFVCLSPAPGTPFLQVTVLRRDVLFPFTDVLSMCFYSFL
jgi:hypothetical protein